MKLCMTLEHVDFPPDLRVENEARSLIDGGHEVTIVCDNHTGRPETEEYQGIRVIRRVPPARPMRKAISLFYLLSNLHYSWYRALLSLHQTFPFSALHIHDLPLAYTGLRVGHHLDLPVVLDLHENYPVVVSTFISANATRPERIWHGLINRRSRWSRLERSAVRQASRVIVVSPEAKSRIESLGVPAACIVVVQNTLNIPHFAAFPVDQSLISRYAERFTISYVGGLGAHRGIDLLLETMVHLIRKLPNAHLVLVGDHTQYPEIEATIYRLRLNTHVTVVGWQPFSMVPTYMALADVAVLPHRCDEHNNQTIPHKLFQYMFLQKPVVVSDCPPMKRIVEESNCGLVCPWQATPEVWAQTIASLADTELRRKLGYNGQQAVISKYNWTVDSGLLLEMYHSLLGEC